MIEMARSGLKPLTTDPEEAASGRKLFEVLNARINMHEASW